MDQPSQNPSSFRFPGALAGAWRRGEPEGLGARFEDESGAPALTSARTGMGYLVVFMLSGVSSLLSELSTVFGYVLLLICLLFIGYVAAVKHSFEIPKTGKVYLAWLFGYCAWSVAGSPTSPIWDGFKSFVYAVVVVILVSEVGNNRVAWRRMGFAAFLAILFNLVVDWVAYRYTGVRLWLSSHNLAEINSVTLEGNRLSGVYGNANLIGREILLLLILTTWNSRWVSVLAFIVAGVVIYFSESRTATYLYVLITCLYLAQYLKTSVPARVALGCIVALGIALVFQGVVNTPVRAGSEHHNNNFWDRILDPTESETKAGRRRADVAENWLTYFQREPWYGYGFEAQAGNIALPDNPRKDLPYLGTHDIYLGVYADAGFVGLLTYLLLLYYGIAQTVRAKPRGSTRTALISLWVVILIFGTFANSLPLMPDGDILYMMAFLIPFLPIFGSARPSQAQS